MAKFSQLKDDLDFSINVIAEGQQVAKEISANLAGLRGELKALHDLQNSYYAAESARRAADAAALAASNKARAAAKALADEQKRLADEQKKAADAAQAQTDRLTGLAKGIAAAAVAFAAFQGFRAFVREGLEFNQTLETANLGIGSLITAQAELRDSNGHLITGAAKLTTAQALATDQVNKLRIAGLQTTATTEELVVAFQQAVGVGLRWGMTLDQIRTLTIQMSQAAGALGLPMNQLNEEVRDLLGGNINPRNTRIATALGITNEQVRAAQKAGTLFDFVTKKLEAFTVAGEATARSFAGVMSNVREAFQNFAGDATKPLFDNLKASAFAGLQEVFNMKDARISDSFKGLLDVSQEVFGVMGQQLADAISGAINGAKELSEWFAANKAEVSGIVAGVVLLNEELTSTLSDVVGLTLGLADTGVKAGIFKTIIVGAGAAVATIHEMFQLVIVALGVIGNLVLTTIVAPFIGWLRLLARAAAFFDEELGAKIDRAAQSGEDFMVAQFQGLIKYGEQLQSGGLALDQFANRIAYMEARANAATHALTKMGTAAATAPQVTLTSTAAAPKPGNQKAVAQGEILLSKAELNQQLRDLKIMLDNAQISYKDYYAKRTELQQHAIDRQIAAEQTLLTFTTDEGAKQKILDTIKSLQAERLQIVDDNNEQLRLSEQKLDDEILKAQIQLLKDQGKLTEARALEVELQFRKTSQKLKINGREAGAEIMTTLFDIDTAKTRLEELTKQSKTITDQLALDLSEIQARRSAGAISEREAQQELITAYSRAKTGLEALLPDMQKAAELTKDPQQIAAVEMLRQKMEEMGTTIRRTSDEFIKLKEGGRDALQTGLADFLDQAIEGAKSLKDIWISVANGIVSSLRKIASQMLANLILQQALGFLGSMAGGISSGGATGLQIAGEGAPLTLAASGGYITGPGTGTSDSIPARLSNGEFVVKADAVKAVGVEFLHAINGAVGSVARGRSRTRGYAEGGLVTAAGGNDVGGFAATIGLEEGLVARHIQTNRGTRAVLNVIAANRKAVNGVLGR